MSVLAEIVVGAVLSVFMTTGEVKKELASKNMSSKEVSVAAVPEKYK